MRRCSDALKIQATWRMTGKVTWASHVALCIGGCGNVPDHWERAVHAAVDVVGLDPHLRSLGLDSKLNKVARAEFSEEGAVEGLSVH